MRRPGGKRLFHLDRFGRKLTESVDQELDFHLETRIRQLQREGRSLEEARAEALARFGDPERVAELCRRIDAQGARRRAWRELVSDVRDDVRFALRSLRKARSYTVVTVLSLAAGIGVNACFLTAIHAVWVAPVPGVTGQDRIVDPVTLQDGQELWGWSFPDFLAVQAVDTPLEALTAWTEEDVTVSSTGEGPGAERIHAAYATSEYFRVLGAQPVLGRGFLASENAGPGQHPVAVVSHDLWQTHFGGRSDILGQTLTLNRIPYEVVGVAPEGFRGARVTMSSVDLWVPLVQHRQARGEDSIVHDRARLSVQVLGRLRHGATRSETQAALQTVFGRLASEYPETNESRTVRAASFGRFPAQNRVFDLMAMAGLWGILGVLLLIICGNLAGMTLARSATREREIGVRLALGSSRLRLIRHLMVEAFILALAGGAVGTLMALIAMATVSPLDLGVYTPGFRFQPSGWVLAMSFATALVAALLVGLVPSLRFSRPELVGALKDDPGGGGRRVGRIQRIAASAQAGAALAFLVVGALFLRSLSRTDDHTLGFEADGLVVTDYAVGALSSSLLDLSEEGYATLEDGGGALLDGLMRTLGSLPGVKAVALGDGVPLDRLGNFGRVAPIEAAEDPESRIRVEFTRVTEGYFTAIGAPVVLGRGFRSSDDASSEAVAVITRPLAERLWPGETPLGRQFNWPAGSEGARPRTVIGVVDRVASSRAGEDWPHVFLPLRQNYSPQLMILLRTSADPASLGEPIRTAMQSVDPGLPLPHLLPGRSVVGRATREQRSAGQLGGALGLLVVILSAMGVHGVVALAVTHRRKEIGLRMALGATQGEVALRVLGDTLRLSAPGMAMGALIAAGVAAAMRSMLLGLSPLDPVSFLAAAGLLIMVILLASLAPALRASGIHPVDALRPE